MVVGLVGVLGSAQVALLALILGRLDRLGDLLREHGERLARLEARAKSGTL